MMSSPAFSCSFCEAPRSALLTYQSKVSGIQTPTCFLPRLETKSGIFLKARRKDFSIKDMDGLHCLNTRVSRICLQSFISTRCSMDASFGGSSPKFPRINVRDPYKRLGISREASQEEVLAARTFLVNQYSGHKPSVDAIESAYDKILSENLKERRRTKFDFQGKWKKLTQSRVAKFIGSRFGDPSLEMILKTGALFLALGIWSFLNPTKDGPVYQVALSLIACIYFIYSRLKKRWRAFLYGFGAFIFSWLVGSFLMASVLPPIATGPRSVEVSTSLISYIFLWIASSYLI